MADDEPLVISQRADPENANPQFFFFLFPFSFLIPLCFCPLPCLFSFLDHMRSDWTSIGRQWLLRFMVQIVCNNCWGRIFSFGHVLVSTRGLPQSAVNPIRNICRLILRLALERMTTETTCNALRDGFVRSSICYFITPSLCSFFDFLPLLITDVKILFPSITGGESGCFLLVFCLVNTVDTCSRWFYLI